MLLEWQAALTPLRCIATVDSRAAIVITSGQCRWVHSDDGPQLTVASAAGSFVTVDVRPNARRVSVRRSSLGTKVSVDMGESLVIVADYDTTAEPIMIDSW